MFIVKRTNSSNPDFPVLVKLLDADLAARDGDMHSFYAALNITPYLEHVVIAYVDSLAVGCGAIREHAPKVMEVKRMFVLPEFRGMGIATAVLSELERWAAELDYEQCVLETGKKQPEAVRLYKQRGYVPIPNYGKYVGVENSVCFEKRLTTAS